MMTDDGRLMHKLCELIRRGHSKEGHEYGDKIIYIYLDRMAQHWAVMVKKMDDVIGGSGIVVWRRNRGVIGHINEKQFNTLRETLITTPNWADPNAREDRPRKLPQADFEEFMSL